MSRETLPSDPVAEARHKRTVRMSTMISTAASILGICGILFPLAWRYVLAPILATTVSTQVLAQVNQHTESTVQAKVAPLNGAFKVILQQQIADLEREVDRLEFERRDASRPGSTVEWTIDKVNELRDKTNRLESNRAALRAILRAESDP